jgi:putative transposase
MMIDTQRNDQDNKKIYIFTYCLMPDHLHYLISPREDGISVLRFTVQFKGKITNLSWKFGWKGKFWQPRYYDHIVRKEESISAIAQYIVNNPVRKELVEYAEEWLWSGTMNPLLL